MKRNKLYTFVFIIICVCTNCNSFSKKNIVVSSLDEIVLLDTNNVKMGLDDLNISERTLFFWFSEKCCGACIEKEIERINKSNVSSEFKSKIIFITPIRPIRVWRRESKEIKKYHKVMNRLYCLYSLYSITDQESHPYYILYDNEKGVFINLFYPDRYDASKTYNYLNNFEKISQVKVQK